MLLIQPYNFRVVHVKGKNNIADPLSRLLGANTSQTLSKAQLEDMAYIRFANEVTTRKIKLASAKDDELWLDRNCINFQNWKELTGPNIYEAIKDDLYTVGKLILRSNRLLTP